MSDYLVAVGLGLFFSVPAVVAAWFCYRILAAVRTPSGDPIGHVSERTEHLAAVNSAMLRQHGKVLTDGQIDHVYERVEECLQLLDVLKGQRRRK